MPILSLSGPRFSGKSFCSQIVTQLDPRFTTMSFASIPKKQYAEENGIEIDELNSPVLKERHRRSFIKFVEAKKEGNKGYWAERLVENITSEFVVIDDLRFIEELREVVKLKGLAYTVHANPEVRKARGWIFDAKVDEHYSETEMCLSPYTFFCLTGGGVIYNNEIATEHKLRAQIYKLLATHFS